ncbi:HAD family hydrolase [Novimethylophilus kurashikiensis]|uniref:HAD family hydrolase n=1 Tax=Novimethylophilus kurashikiensis TaxID=1825523 RepID=A0A2R5FB09_9PROT|nr:TIGR01459 family HAD-type hydrolase [Novimethylophilus kurashikiensis]GBG14738.1 HAD family hydrolase [Novimethylophilus kurashikiensis]
MKLASQIELDALQGMEPAFWPSPRKPSFIQSLSAIADKYDIFLIDQWGVLHNGIAPYSGVIDALENLQRLGKAVGVLSNSGLRSNDNITRLHHLGIPRALYSSIVTSGEVAWQLFKDADGVFSEFSGKRCFLISSDRSAHFLEGLDIAQAHDLDDADFILLSGLNPDISESTIDMLIETGVSNGLPLICANPDHMRITNHGLKPSAGMVALRYEAAGGAVIQIGKPFKEIYRYAIQSLSRSPKDRVLAIGDSLHHDVAGGNAAGCDTLLIEQGILSHELAEFKTAQDKENAVMRLAECESQIPNWIATTLSW